MPASTHVTVCLAMGTVCQKVAGYEYPFRGSSVRSVSRAYQPSAADSARRERSLRSYSTALAASSSCLDGLPSWHTPSCWFYHHRSSDHAERTRGDESLRSLSGFPRGVLHTAAAVRHTRDTHKEARELAHYPRVFRPCVRVVSRYHGRFEPPGTCRPEEALRRAACVRA